MYCHLFIALYYLKPIFALEPPDLPDYCLLSCDEKQHIVCKRGYVCEPIKNCLTMPVDAPFRKKMLSTHNILRNNIASGVTKTHYGNTGARNMRALSYDMELEFLAECWASLCRARQHDDCRQTDRFSVGQNIYYARNLHDPERAVQEWFQQGIQYTKSLKIIKKFPYHPHYLGNSTFIFHFTQMIWAETKYVGCSWARFGPEHIDSIIICNYGPAGNEKDLSVYKMAIDPAFIADQCPEGRNPQYRSLCGCIDHISEEPSWAKSFDFEPDIVDIKSKAREKSPPSLKLLALLLFLVNNIIDKLFSHRNGF